MFFEGTYIEVEHDGAVFLIGYADYADPDLPRSPDERRVRGLFEDTNPDLYVSDIQRHSRTPIGRLDESGSVRETLVVLRLTLLSAPLHELEDAEEQWEEQNGSFEEVDEQALAIARRL